MCTIRCLAAHPELEVVQRPAPDEDGVERQFPRNAGDAWWFKVKDGVKQVRFGDPGWRLGFARDAINSYYVFSVMKEKGVLPPHLRFQVSIPQVNSVLPPRIFPNPERSRTHPARLRGGNAGGDRQDRREDSAAGTGDSVGLRNRNAGCVRELSRSCRSRERSSATSPRSAICRPHIPADVALGYHFCFGTLGGWPRFQPDDLGQAVKLANAFVAASGRRVDWIHIPVLDRSDDAFFAPLKDLDPQGRARLPRRHSQYAAVRVSELRPHANICPNSDLGPIAGSAVCRFPNFQDILDDHIKAVALAAER